MTFLGSDSPTPLVFEGQTTAPASVQDGPAADRLAGFSRNPAIVEALGDDPDSWRQEPRRTASLLTGFDLVGPNGRVHVKISEDHAQIGHHTIKLPTRRILYGADGARALALTNSSFVRPLAVDPRALLVIYEPLPPGPSLQARLIARERMPGVFAKVTTAIAEASFRTSDLANDFQRQQNRIAHFSGNAPLTLLNAELIFDAPYIQHPTNAWTAPDLDGDVRDMVSDNALRLSAQQLKVDYLTRSDALLHNDLHCGHVFVDRTPDENGEVSVAINPSEFSRYGPMEFDSATFIAGFFLNLFAQSGLGQGAASYQGWMMREFELAGQRASESFAELWRTERTGTAFTSAALNRSSDLDEMALSQFVWLRHVSLLGFTGAEMIRRILGMARSPDMLQIDSPAARAASERRALAFARELILGRATLGGPLDMLNKAEDCLRMPV